jgi:chromosome segregation ATPase
MTHRKKLCSNCGLIPAERYMKKLADQNFYCNDCREALVDCSAKELKNLGHPYYLNFQKLKNEQGQIRSQQRSQSQELTALRQEKNRLASQLTNLQTALDKANQEIQNEREIHQDSLKIQDDWYRRLPSEGNNLKNILTDFAQKYLKLNLKNKLRKQRIKELESSLELTKKLAKLQIQELQEQLTELQQEDIALRNDLEVAVKEKKEIQEDTQKVIQNHQQEILQLQQQIQQSELPKPISRFTF